MLALSPNVFPTFGWPLEEPTTVDQVSYFSRDQPRPTTNSLLYYQAQQEIFLEPDLQSTSFTACTSSADPTMTKKLNHNASERDRRKKMNTLYSSLRSLIPSSDRMKRLSIPATISMVLKHIPELQQQLETLVQRKEELLLKLSKQDNLIINPQLNKRKNTCQNTLSIVSANQLGDKEIVMQISTHNNTTLLSEILLFLEEEGLVLTNSSSFQSSDGKVFYNLHFQVEGSYRVECDALSEKIASLYEKKDEFFREFQYVG
ncbi:transcription factor ORG2-like [Mercurialis annua]|uniref:transcription factor ORG2-like n=1 Tax=Mercurialis annua TaxID=3986 RepID=UPI0021607D1B|nr:transcription factor ORG2-like [Mercurialis annua]